MDKYRLTSISFMGLSILCIIGPWLFFNHSVDYSEGIDFVTPFLLFSYLGYFIFILINERIFQVRLCSLIFAFAIPIICIIIFCVWDNMFVLGKVSTIFSFIKVNYSICISFVLSLASAMIYLIGFNKAKI